MSKGELKAKDQQVDWNFFNDIKKHIDYSIFAEDEDLQMSAILKTIDDLPEWKRKILLIYAELGSCAKVADRLKLSSGIVYRYVKEIQKEVRDGISKYITD